MTSSTDRSDASRCLLRALCALLCLAAVVAGCATPRAPVSDEERQAYEEALERVDEDRVGATAALLDFRRRWPNSQLSDAVDFKLGELAQEEGRTEAALGYFNAVIRGRQDKDLVARARVHAAQLERALGNAKGARRHLSGLAYDQLPPEEQLVAYHLLAKLATDTVEQLRWLGELRASEHLNADDQFAVDVEIAELVSRLSSDDLVTAVEIMAEYAFGARMQLELASRALDVRDLDSAQKALAAARTYELSDSDRTRVEELSTRLSTLELMTGRTELPTFREALAHGGRAPRPDTGTIAVLLPLSGPFASYGEASLRGVLLAAELFEREGGVEAEGSAAAGAQGDTQPVAAPARQGFRRGESEAPNKLRVLVRDTAGDPIQAAAAVRELARKDDVLAIIGPLLSAECEAAARAAEDAEVPLLALSSRQEIAKEREQAFRLRTTPDDEIHFLVNHAAEELGAKRFAILYPKDTFGRGMRDRFWRSVELAGGSVVAVSSYEPEAVDFAKSIREMIGYVLLTPQEQAALRQRDQLLQRGRRLEPDVAATVREVAYSILGPMGEALPPVVDFDALFIPDAHDKIVLIAPQLAFHELDQVQLLGSAGWVHPDLTRIARKHVRGAVIATPFYEQSPFPFVEEFVARYGETFHTEPDSYSALAYDATNLLFAQLDLGVTTREEFREGMLRVSGYPGVSGVFTLLPDGNARKRPYLLRVRGGRLIPLD